MRISDLSSDVCSSDLLVEIECVRTNQLVGYGVVVGLDGTGDRLKDSPFTERSLKGMLERLGVNVREDELKTRNAASVIVTATLPPFARQGSSIDVSVASLGNASSLLGGTLIRSEEHTSELPSLLRISSAVFCLKKKQT